MIKQYQNYISPQIIEKKGGVVVAVMVWLNIVLQEFKQ